jgi:hypothetical protein
MAERQQTEEARWRVGVLAADLLQRGIDLCLVKYADHPYPTGAEYAVGVTPIQVDGWQVPDDLFRVRLTREDVKELIETLRSKAGLPNETEKYKAQIEAQKLLIQILVDGLVQAAKAG